MAVVGRLGPSSQSPKDRINCSSYQSEPGHGLIIAPSTLVCGGGATGGGAVATARIAGLLLGH